MLKAEHSFGPWEVKEEEVDRDYIRVRGTICGGRYKIANVPTPANSSRNDVAETRANARLIAAAPDLLEALVEMRDRIPLSSKALAAIEKAALA